MNASMLALGAALTTLFVYHLLTEHLDYASVRRRQLDAWAAASALTCMLIVFYGRVEDRFGQGAIGVERAGPRPAAILRVHQPSLYLPPAKAAEPEGLAVPLDEPGSLGEATTGGDIALPESDSKPETLSSEEPNVPRIEAVPMPDDILNASAKTAAPLLSEGPAIEAVEPEPSPTIQRLVTRAPVFVTAPPVPTADPQPTLVAPKPDLPTLVPPPTPHCGDPEAIRVSLRIDEAVVDRDDDRQVIRYRARLRNDSSFPVTASRMVVTAQDSRSGSDHFGSDRRPDLTVDREHEVQFEGAVRIDKHPSPFGRSELCISFVSDSCGRQPEFATTRRCFAISGF